MHLLQSIDDDSFETIFEEERVSPEQRDRLFEHLQKQGSALVGKHLSKGIYLFKSDNGYTVVDVSCDQRDGVPLSLGVLVEDVESKLEELWQDDSVDVFDAGSVGSLALHIPAYRDEAGRIVYLVDNQRVSDFYIRDFKVVEGNICP